jgi:hypothetical protein
VAVVDRSFSEPFAVDAYPTNLIVGPYGRAIYRGEGFDSRIADIVESYAPGFEGSPLTGGSPMVPEEFRECSSSSRSSCTRSPPELDLSSDSPVQALKSLGKRAVLSELKKGLSDTYLRNINSSLYSLLEAMRERDRYAATYDSFRSRNPDAADVLSDFTSSDTSVNSRSVYRSLTTTL